MIVNIGINTTALDVAFNLSGSLAGFPVVIEQMPTTTRVGFDDLPKMWEDSADIGQTWTPYIEGMSLDLNIPLYNSLGVEKSPYTTDLTGAEIAWEYGNGRLKRFFSDGVSLPELGESGVTENISGMEFKLTNTDKKPLYTGKETDKYPIFYVNWADYYNVPAIIYGDTQMETVPEYIGFMVDVFEQPILRDPTDVFVNGEWKFPEGQIFKVREGFYLSANRGDQFKHMRESFVQDDVHWNFSYLIALNDLKGLFKDW